MESTEATCGASEAARRQSAIRTIINDRDRAIDEVETLRAEVARVRADTLRQFAELMRVSAEEAPADEPAKWPYSAYALAAVKAEEYAARAAESVVGALPDPARTEDQR